LLRPQVGRDSGSPEMLWAFWLGFITYNVLAEMLLMELKKFFE